MFKEIFEGKMFLDDLHVPYRGKLWQWKNLVNAKYVRINMFGGINLAN